MFYRYIRTGSAEGVNVISFNIPGVGTAPQGGLGQDSSSTILRGGAISIRLILGSRTPASRPTLNTRLLRIQS